MIRNFVKNIISNKIKNNIYASYLISKYLFPSGTWNISKKWDFNKKWGKI